MRLPCPPNVSLSFYQFSLTVNAPVWRCVCTLIYYNIDIDSWDCWDFVLSVIGTRMSCLCVLSVCCVNAPFYQFFHSLIDCYIYSWNCWDCFLSVIVPVRLYMYLPSPYCWCFFTSCITLLSMRLSNVLLIHLHFCQWFLLSILLYVGGKQYW